MILSYVWAAVTSVFVVTGFFAGWRQGKLIYRSQLPTPLQPVWGPAGWVHPPALVSPQTRPMVPFASIFARTWGLWVAGGQVMYWAVKVVYMLVHTDVAAPLVWGAAHMWIALVAIALVALVWGALLLWRGRRVDDQEVVVEQPQPTYSPIPVAPVQPVLWSAPDLDRNWAER